MPREFRLIRSFSVDHNASRLRTYVKRLTKAPKHRALAALMRMKRRAIPTKAVRTQLDNLKELANLRAVFGRMLIEAVKPHHVRAT